MLCSFSISQVLLVCCVAPTVDLYVTYQPRIPAQMGPEDAYDERNGGCCRSDAAQPCHVGNTLSHCLGARCLRVGERDIHAQL